MFDFGLCKALSEDLKAKDSKGRDIYGYNLTGRTGSIPYMAPEIVDCKAYDTKCDVFSFSILLWEILSLNVAYKGYSRREFLQRVVRDGERMTIRRSWPTLTKVAIRESWDHNPQSRPDMKQIAAMLRDDLDNMSEDRKR